MLSSKAVQLMQHKNYQSYAYQFHDSVTGLCPCVESCVRGYI